SEGCTWVCDVREKEVLVSVVDGAERTATVSGPPEQVLLWLWGRAGDEAVTFDGDPEVISEFRARLVECTR
nr:hypothetical protein [Nocardioidaceae bacterium]